MNVYTHTKLQKLVVVVLKKKFTNLSVLEALDMANEIISSISEYIKEDE